MHLTLPLQHCRPWAWLWLALMSLATGLAQAQDDPPGRVGRFAAVQGEVWVFEPEQGEWVAAVANRPYTGGDRVATGNGSSVELRIGSTTLLLGSQAELEALRLDDQRMQFRLQRGPLGLQLRSDDVAAELELAQAEARFLPRRAGLYRIDRLDGLDEATVLRGELQVEAHNLAMTLYAGQRAAFWRDGALGDTRSQWLGPQRDDFALALQTMEQADPRSAAALFVPPEMTGVEDLDHHGRWQQHPEYGAVWSPSAVAVEWAPYRYGRWVWLRPWGWTWVDDAPWGFAPFHYGRWLWWGNRWCWAPGPKVARPVYAPALVGWVGGPQFSVAVGSRPVPAMGWLPLGPRDPYRPPYSATPGHVKRLNPHVPPGSLPPPAFGNRGVPGAVTVWPSPSLAPRQPVGAAALRADEMALRRMWQAEDFSHNAPGRPPSPARDDSAPRAVVPLRDAGSIPMPPRPRLPGAAAATPPFATPSPRPPQAQATGPVAPSAQAPVHGRPPSGTHTGAAPRERLPPPVAQTPAAPAPQGAPVAPTRAEPFKPVPAPAPQAAAPPRPATPTPRNDAQEGRNARQPFDPGERRRTPESRYAPRER
ncbi:MAG: hypothetical protein MUF16_05165 [Burkholderiaceae bacterium]|nr:hypothetical protein [Burkholderiaceae bacterium]